MRAQTIAGAAVPPVVLDFLGYHFQAGPLIVAVAGVVIVRLMEPMHAGKRIMWGRELPVMAFCIFMAALFVQNVTNLLFAGGIGCAIGFLGIALLRMIGAIVGPRLQQALAVLFGTGGGAAPIAPPTPAADDPAAIDAAMEDLNKLP